MTGCRFHGRWFKLPVGKPLTRFIMRASLFTKIGILLLNLVPLVALCVVQLRSLFADIARCRLGAISQICATLKGNGLTADHAGRHSDHRRDQLPGVITCPERLPAICQLGCAPAWARYANTTASSGAASSSPQNPKARLSKIGTINDAQIGTRAVRRMMSGCQHRHRVANSVPESARTAGLRYRKSAPRAPARRRLVPVEVNELEPAARMAQRAEGYPRSATRPPQCADSQGAPTLRHKPPP